MSLDATRWAWQQQGIRPLHKLILLSLADRAGTDDSVWPSYGQIAADTGADRKTICSAIKCLKEAGLLADTGERRGKTGQVQVLRLVGVTHRNDELEQFQKRNDSKNGTVPFFPSNSTENGIVNSTENGTRNLPLNLPRNLSSAVDKKPSPAAAQKNRFPEFWEVWPSSSRKVAKAKCAEIWKRRKLDAVAEQIIGHVTAMKATQQWSTGFEPAPTTYLSQRRWEDGDSAHEKPAVRDWI